MKATYKQVKEIIASTPAHLKGMQVSALPNIAVGYYIKGGCNWAYHIHVVTDKDGRMWQVAVVFGEIK